MLIKRKSEESGYGQRSDARHGERGIALILCIGFLALLSILGTVVINLTNENLSQSWKDQAAKNVFYTADRAVEYALSPSVYTNLVDVGDQVDMTDNAYKPDIIGTGTELVKGIVTYEGSGEAPSNSSKYDKLASSGKVYRYYHISVEARSTHSRVTDTSFVDGMIVQAFPAVTNVPVEYVTGDVDAPGSGGN